MVPFGSTPTISELYSVTVPPSDVPQTSATVSVKAAPDTGAADVPDTP